MTSNKVAMLGLDGATFNVLDPAFAEGHMPRFKSLLDRGVSGVLTSTVPPYTPPGWTSIFTGVNPGRHGIFGFTLGHVQESRGLVRLDRVAAPAVWNAANAQGMQMGLFNIPMTFPPPAVDGWAVSGMLTPEGGGETPDSFTWPQELGDELSKASGGYEIDIEVDYDEDWKSTEIIERLSANLARKRTALAHLLRTRDVPFLFAVLEAPDRLMHVHYKYIDPACEHYDRPEAKPIRERAWKFFDEMDAFIGDVLDWVGPDGFVLTMSDHGFGPKHKTVNINLALREWGLLGISGAGAMTRSAGVRKLARRAKKALPKSVWQKAKGAAQSSIDWSTTKAFSAPIPQQGIYINLEGREPQGIVPPSEYEEVRDEVIARLTSLIDPDDGKPVVDKVLRREDAIEGPEASGAPDLYPVCRAYSYELSDGLYSPSILDDYTSLPRGFHHMDGIFGIAGPGITPESGATAHLYDMAPTALYLAGLKVPRMDGAVLARYLPEELLERRPVVVDEDMSLPLAGAGAEASPYSAADEALIEESLRNLGYL
ncbi:MAG TPA: alkaline phosphatase family protein [Actinomycetota bacterium]|nr:alkaline phosphatase family protein [Actinomycetota bacterium]